MKSLSINSGRLVGAPSALRLKPGLVRLLEDNAVTIEVLDAWTCRLSGVPVSTNFNKPRTNLLLKWMRFTTGINAFVDDDLSYSGDDTRLIAMLQGPTFKLWRKLRAGKLEGATDAVFVQVLHLLCSPLAAAAQQAIRRPRQKKARPSAARPALGPILRSVGEWVPPATTAKALATCVHGELVRHLAAAATRLAVPRSFVLGGAAGSGRDHLMLAVAHQLRQRGQIRDVLRVPTARIAAGNVLSTDLDAALGQFLADAVAVRGVLLLVQDLDVCVSGSPVSDSLLCHALDQGLRMLATVRSASSVEQLMGSKALAHRLLAVQLEDPAYEDVEKIANDFAATSRIEVLPETIRTVVKMATHENSGAPAVAISLLAAAIADAAWNYADYVGPDNVFASQRNQWFDG